MNNKFSDSELLDYVCAIDGGHIEHVGDGCWEIAFDGGTLRRYNADSLREALCMALADNKGCFRRELKMSYGRLR